MPRPAARPAPLSPTEKADVLLEALRWIRNFRGRTTVIKLGGSVLEDETSLRHLLIDIVFMESVGMRPVVVHGGGAAISRAMDAEGLTPRFIQGRRYTDERTLQIVEEELADKTNEMLCGQIEELGGHAAPLNFRRQTDVLFGKRLMLPGNGGADIDLGFVGHVTDVDTNAIQRLCEMGWIPVIPSMCLADDGTKYNVNADTAAMTVAEKLKAEKLIFLSDVNGVRSDKNNPDTLIHSLSASEARRLIASGAVDSGMIPKIEACLDILDRGIRKVHIVDGRERHSLLLEVYTARGVGTEITRG